MNLQRFDELMKAAGGAGGQLIQNISEWQCFLEFVDAYFKNRDILNPIIVEIGVANNSQKSFYRELLNAEHIGIDIIGNPDILGDSHNLETVEKLKTRLSGRPVDLLFIDGGHMYESVKADYELYGPLTKHIIAFHDIYTRFPNPADPAVYRLWDEIIEKEKRFPLVIFKKDNSVEWGFQVGIGCILKEKAGG